MNKPDHDPTCPGTLFKQHGRAAKFKTCVRSVYLTPRWSKYPSRNITGSLDLLAEFCQDVFRSLSQVVTDKIGKERLVYWNSNTIGAVHPADGFSFMEHVCKRLVVLRKTGMLNPNWKPKPKAPPNPNRRRSATGGAVILELF